MKLYIFKNNYLNFIFGIIFSFLLNSCDDAKQEENLLVEDTYYEVMQKDDVVVYVKSKNVEIVNNDPEIISIRTELSSGGLRIFVTGNLRGEASLTVIDKAANVSIPVTIKVLPQFLLVKYWDNSEDDIYCENGLPYNTLCLVDDESHTFHIMGIVYRGNGFYVTSGTYQIEYKDNKPNRLVIIGKDNKYVRNYDLNVDYGERNKDVALNAIDRFYNHSLDDNVLCRFMLKNEENDVIFTTEMCFKSVWIPLYVL